MSAAAGGATRERILRMLMLYSGRAIRNASTLRRGALVGAELMVRRTKSGELVMSTLPSPVADELVRWGRDRSHFFWTGSSKPGTVTNYWCQWLGQIVEKAGVEGFRTHRLRARSPSSCCSPTCRSRMPVYCWATAVCKPRSATKPRGTGLAATGSRGSYGTPTSGIPCSWSCTGIQRGNWTGAATAAPAHRPAQATRSDSSAQVHELERYTAYLL